MVGAVGGIAVAQVDAHEAEGTRPACIVARGEARMQAYGWDHVVVVRNGCASRTVCEITTSVNPSPTTVPIAPNETRETLMWRGSPARAFSARVDCEAER